MAVSLRVAGRTHIDGVVQTNPIAMGGGGAEFENDSSFGGYWHSCGRPAEGLVGGAGNAPLVVLIITVCLDIRYPRPVLDPASVATTGLSLGPHGHDVSVWGHWPKVD